MTQQLPATPRPLRVKLTPQDVLFFQHVPKTGGTSLIAYLDAQFPPESIFPHHSDPQHVNFKTLLGEDAPLPKPQYRLVRGHIPFGPLDEGVYRYITHTPIHLTMLREPIARFISEYRHFTRHGRIPADTTLEAFIRGDFTAPQPPNMYNRQARTLTGSIEGNVAHDIQIQGKKFLPPDVLLYNSKKRLEETRWLGIMEQFNASVELLAYTFGWDMPAEIPVLNTAPEPFDLNSLSPEIREMMHELVYLDTEIYNYACEIFAQRRSQMASELFAASRRAGVSVHVPSRAVREHWREKQVVQFKERRQGLRSILLPEKSRREKAYLFIRLGIVQSLIDRVRKRSAT